MSTKNIGRNDPCPCGSGRKYKACCLVSQQPQEPKHPPPLDTASRKRLLQAFDALQAGHLELATKICETILRACPVQPDALHLQGLIAQRQGRVEDALQRLDQALGVAESDAMHSNRGILLQELGRLQEAVAAFDRALALNPRSAAAHFNRGGCLSALGDFEEAISAFKTCLGLLQPQPRALDGLGWKHLIKAPYGTTPLAVGAEVASASASSDSEMAIRVDALMDMGSAYYRKGEPLAAIQSYRQALALDPQRATAWSSLGVALNEVNRLSDARDAFNKAFELEPTLSRRLRKSLHLGCVVDSADDLASQRRRFEMELDELLTSTERLDAISGHDFCTGLFKLAYHGDDVRPLIQRIAQMYERLCPALRYQAPHVAEVRRSKQPVRLGFFTFHVHDHPVSHCFSTLIKHLALDPCFEVVLISNRNLPTGDVRKPYEGFAGQFVKVAAEPFKARAEIAALGLDVLTYLDVGMEALSYFLGFARLARVQCVLGGHPITTGLPEIDIYLSSALGEPDGAQAHYTERLVLIEPVTVSFQRPELPPRFKACEELGLPPAGNLYVCPMMLQKIHPDFDAAVAEILALDPLGHAIFFATPSADWETYLRARLDRRLKASERQRLHFLPWVHDRNDFAAINHHASVVIDPFHFGIGSTAITTVAVATPIITWPSDFLRGRVGLLCARQLETPECVAPSREAYATTAVRIATDPVLRASISQRMRAHSHRFFDTQGASDTMRAFFLSLRDSMNLTSGTQSLELA